MMTYEEMVFEIMKSIAPLFVCKGEDRSILEAQAQSAKEWAEAFVNVLYSKNYK